MLPLNRWANPLQRSLCRLIVVLFLVQGGCTANSANRPQVLTTVSLDGDHFYGAAANSEGFFVLVDDTLHAFSSSGVHVWQKNAPWYKRPDDPSGDELRPPNFNRPAPVVMRNAVVVLNCKNWQLSLDAYDFAGNLLATVKPLSHDMRIQDGVLHMDKAANRLAFGYRLESGTTFDNPDKGLLVFDEKLHKLREHDVWGDHLCCSDDGSLYARTVRWGKDTKWARILPDGQTTLLPTTVSRGTSVVEPGVGGEMILRGSGVRRIWKPANTDASVIYEGTSDCIGDVVACPNSRYVLRVWPDHKQEFLCLSSEGKTVWEHPLTLSCYFWPPQPLCDPDGKVYLMDTVRGFHLWASDVVVRCLAPSGETTWELTVDQTNDQPVFASCLSPSGSHLLLVRRPRLVNDPLSHKIKLVFVATGNGDME